MHAERTTQGLPSFGGSVNVDTLGEQLGLSPSDSRNVAQYLQAIGWAVVSEPNLTLTPLGFEEVARVRRPAWVRWLDRHPAAVGLFWMTLVSIASGVTYTVITYFLLRP